jgi:hypothetical protein
VGDDEVMETSARERLRRRELWRNAPSAPRNVKYGWPVCTAEAKYHPVDWLDDESSVLASRGKSDVARELAQSSTVKGTLPAN